MAVQSTQQYIYSILQPQMSKKVQLGSDAIEMYKPYARVEMPLKTFDFGGHLFQIDQYYYVDSTCVKRKYGGVYYAKDYHLSPQDPEIVVIKMFPCPPDQKHSILRAIRDLRMGRLLQHENILAVKTAMLPQSRQEFKEIYTVWERVDYDLGQIIKSQMDFTHQHISFFLYQILRGLKYIHSAGITHRHLCPQHLLVYQNCDLKISNFSESTHSSNEKACYNDTNRWYSSPESVTSQMGCNQTMDIWSAGCIFAEMFLMKPLLRGKDINHQLALILDLLGLPSQQYLDSIQKKSKKLIIKTFKKIADSRQFGKDLSEIIPYASPLAIDLLKKMLTFDPRERITVWEALKHPYLSGLHLEEDEPSRGPISALELEFEDHSKLSSEQLKDVLYEEILLHHFEDFRKDYETRREKGESLIAHIRSKSNAKYQEKW